MLCPVACAPAANVTAEGDGAAESDLIECALHGAGAFARECTVERARDGGVATLIVRHPDGGFRRFEILGDRRGLASADGAEPAETEWRDGGIGLAVGADRYRFPASIIADVSE
jgi:hypothetical protein